ncbi:sugar ABC transporter substrate-binding protein [Azotobacter vinelandii]
MNPLTRLRAPLRLLTLFSLLLGAAPAPADDGAQVPSLAGKRIAVSMTGTSHYFDIKAFQAQVDEIKRLGGTPITLDAGRNDRNLVTQLQTVVTQKPDAVIQTLGTLSVIDPWLRRIAAAGIPLFTIDVPSQYSLNNTTSDNHAAGRALAERLAEDTGGQGNILVFNGFYGVPVCAIRYDELQKVLAARPGLKVIQPELRDVIPNTVQDARAQIAALLNKYPKGEIAAIWAAWDIPQLGASQALIDAGRSEIRTYGVDGTPEVLELLKRADSPVGAVVAQQPELIGRTAVRNVARYLAGQRDLPKETHVATLLTTRDNLDQVNRLRGDQ